MLQSSPTGNEDGKRGKRKREGRKRERRRRRRRRRRGTRKQIPAFKCDAQLNELHKVSFRMTEKEIKEEREREKKNFR